MNKVLCVAMLSVALSGIELGYCTEDAKIVVREQLGSKDVRLITKVIDNTLKLADIISKNKGTNYDAVFNAIHGILQKLQPAYVKLGGDKEWYGLKNFGIKEIKKSLQRLKKVISKKEFLLFGLIKRDRSKINADFIETYDELGEMTHFDPLATQSREVKLEQGQGNITINTAAYEQMAIYNALGDLYELAIDPTRNEQELLGDLNAEIQKIESSYTQKLALGAIRDALIKKLDMHTDGGQTNNTRYEEKIAAYEEKIAAYKELIAKYEQQQDEREKQIQEYVEKLNNPDQNIKRLNKKYKELKEGYERLKKTYTQEKKLADSQIKTLRELSNALAYSDHSNKGYNLWQLNKYIGEYRKFFGISDKFIEDAQNVYLQRAKEYYDEIVTGRASNFKELETMNRGEYWNAGDILSREETERFMAQRAKIKTIWHMTRDIVKEANAAWYKQNKQYVLAENNTVDAILTEALNNRQFNDPEAFKRVCNVINSFVEKETHTYDEYMRLKINLDLYSAFDQNLKEDTEWIDNLAKHVATFEKLSVNEQQRVMADTQAIKKALGL